MPAPNRGARSAPPFDMPPPCPQAKRSHASRGGSNTIAVRASTRFPAATQVSAARAPGAASRFASGMPDADDWMVSTVAPSAPNAKSDGPSAFPNRSRTSARTRAVRPEGSAVSSAVEASAGCTSMRATARAASLDCTTSSTLALEGSRCGTEQVTEAIAPSHDTRAGAPPREASRATRESVLPIASRTAARTAISSPARAGDSGSCSEICAAGPGETSTSSSMCPADGSPSTSKAMRSRPGCRGARYRASQSPPPLGAGASRDPRPAIARTAALCAGPPSAAASATATRSSPPATTRVSDATAAMRGSEGVSRSMGISRALPN